MYRSKEMSAGDSFISEERLPSLVASEFNGKNGRSNGHMHHLSFLERLREYPLVRDATSFIQDKYETAKERNGILKQVLERGESTVAGSWTRANFVAEKTGIKTLLGKPLSFVDLKASQMLDTVEKKFPIVQQTQYEIKLSVRGRVDGALDQITAVRDNFKHASENAIHHVKHSGEQRLQALLDTPIGQTLTEKLEETLNRADRIVDAVLPERNCHGNHHQNGKVTGGMNGYVSKTNGYHGGNLEHAKCLTSKLVRRVSLRVSTKSHDLVDAVKRNSVVCTGKEMLVTADKRSKTYVGQVRAGVQKTLLGFLELVDSGVFATLALTAKVLPPSANQKLNSFFDSVLARVPKVHTNGKTH